MLRSSRRYCLCAEPFRFCLFGIIPATFVALAALGGCATSPPTLPAASDIQQSAKALYLAAGSTVPSPLTPQEFAEVGYNVVDSECSQYFDEMAEAHSGLKMSTADITAAGAAAAVISTLAKASAKQIGITAAVFGFAGIVVDNVDKDAFATPYPIQTRTLVLKALTAYRQASSPDSATSLPSAMDLVSGYANLCTYAGIASLSEQAISTATPVNISQGQSIFSADERASYLAPIDLLLRLPSGVQPTDSDYAILAAIADPKTTDARVPSLLSKLSASVGGAVSDEIFDTTAQTRKPIVPSLWGLLSPLMTANSQFAAEVHGYETGAPVALFAPRHAVKPMIAIK